MAIGKSTKGQTTIDKTNI